MPDAMCRSWITGRRLPICARSSTKRAETGPIIALGLKWMEDNCPDPVEPVLNHGDYRMGNLLAEDSGKSDGRARLGAGAFRRPA